MRHHTPLHGRGISLSPRHPPESVGHMCVTLISSSGITGLGQGAVRRAHMKGESNRGDRRGSKRSLTKWGVRGPPQGRVWRLARPPGRGGRRAEVCVAQGACVRGKWWGWAGGWRRLVATRTGAWGRVTVAWGVGGWKAGVAGVGGWKAVQQGCSWGAIKPGPVSAEGTAERRLGRVAGEGGQSPGWIAK